MYRLRERLDAERIYGKPSKKRNWILTKGSNALGRILNIEILRPNKGKVFGRPKSFSRKDALALQKKKSKGI